MGVIPPWAVPGAKVVCVEPSPAASFYGWEKLPVVGEVYTIRDIVFPDGGTPCIRLDEISNAVSEYFYGPAECSFKIARFRPLISKTQEQDVALFEPLLNSKSVEVDA